MKIKQIKTCDKCRKAFKDMKLKSEFFSYGKIICNNCYIEDTQNDAE